MKHTAGTVGAVFGSSGMFWSLRGANADEFWSLYRMIQKAAQG